MGARWYDSYLARWLSADTLVPNLANPQDLNRYSYVRNSPLKFVDPTGHMEEGECSFNDEGCEGQPPDLEDFVADLVELGAEILQGTLEGILDPARTEPIVISIPGNNEKIIIMPAGSSPCVDRNPIAKEIGQVLGRAGLLLDLGELVLIYEPLPGDEDYLGAIDWVVTATSDWASGSSDFFQEIHPSLPPVAFIGQDTLWTSGTDTVVPGAAKVIGSSTAGPVGYGLGEAVDTATTGLSALYDAGRYLNIIPNVLKRGLMHNGGPSFTDVWIIYPSELQ
jgi:hypothetical protein